MQHSVVRTMGVRAHTRWSSERLAQTLGQLPTSNPGNVLPGNAAGLDANSTQTARLITLDWDDNGSINTAVRGKAAGTNLEALDATEFIAASARQSCGTGLFCGEENGQNPKQQWWDTHSGRSKIKTVHAYSMRFSGPKGLGRRMDIARSCFLIG